MGGSSTKTESSNTVDPQLMALYQQNYATASQVANTPFQPYTGERVAGFTPAQIQGQNALLSAASDPTALNAIGRAQNSVSGLMNYQAPTIAAPTIGTPTLVAATQVSPVSVAAGQLSQTDLSPYINPYTDDVVNSALADLQHARQVQGVADNASATAAHAFGGTRQAVLDANTTNDYLRNVASTTAGLRQSAYQNAQQAALSDIGNRLSADQFNATNRLSADQFNATNGLNADQFNATNRLNADQFNATGAYNAAAANAANTLAGANLQLNAAGQYAGLGSDYFNQLAQQGNLYSTVGAQQQALQQSQDDAAYDEFLRQLNYPYQQQQLRNQALGMMPIQQTQTTQTTKQGDILGGVLGTLAGGAQLGAAMYNG